jgi:hypothetical protein
MPKITTTTPEVSAANWTSDHPCPESGSGNRDVHKWIMRAACVFHKKGVQIDTAHKLIENSITRDPARGEIEESLAKAYIGVVAVTARRAEAPGVYDPEKLIQIASRVLFEVTDDWLAEQSPECVLGVSPAAFLESIYQPGEKTVIFDVFNSPGQHVYTHEDPEDSLDRFKTGCRDGVWYLVNPSDGESRFNDRLGKCSRRAEENITSFRYGILETDMAPDDLWRRMLVRLPLKVVALYTSGKRGVHWLYRIDATSKAEFDAVVEKNKRKLITLGACEGAMKAVQLSRLPGCRREKEKQTQRLLYLNADPDGSPIYNL